MEIYWVYVLKSDKDGKYYIGQTNRFVSRMFRHITSQVRATKNRLPIRFVSVELVYSRKDAVYLEKKIKSYKGGRAFYNYLNNSAE